MNLRYFFIRNSDILNNYNKKLVRIKFMRIQIKMEIYPSKDKHPFSIQI